MVKLLPKSLQQGKSQHSLNQILKKKKKTTQKIPTLLSQPISRDHKNENFQPFLALHPLMIAGQSSYKYYAGIIVHKFRQEVITMIRKINKEGY